MIVTLPPLTPEARPVELTVATDAFDDDQLTELVIFAELHRIASSRRELNGRTGVNGCRTGRDGNGGNYFAVDLPGYEIVPDYIGRWGYISIGIDVVQAGIPFVTPELSGTVAMVVPFTCMLIVVPIT